MSTTRINRTRTPVGSSSSALTRDADEQRSRVRHLFDDPFARWMRDAFEPLSPDLVGWNPAAEISETDREFTVSLELAGMKARDVNIDFSDGRLTIRGERTSEREEKDEERRYHLWERSYGTFTRAFDFPSVVDGDAIRAELTDGMLMVHLPKRMESAPNGRKIPIAERVQEPAAAKAQAEQPAARKEQSHSKPANEPARE